MTVLFDVSVERRSNWQGHQVPGRRNRKPYHPVVDARPRGQSPVPSESRHTVRTALCPDVSSTGSGPQRQLTTAWRLVKNSPAGNEWLHPTDCQLLSIEKSMSYRGVGGCVSMMFSILSDNEKSNTGQSDRRIE